jgi:hypothetical protein
MNFEGLNCFLSEDNLRRHREFLNTARLKLSILHKSDSRLKGITLDEARRLRGDRSLREELCSLLWCINSHEAYFDSFRVNPYVDPRKRTMSEKMLYDIYSLGMSKDHGFIYISGECDNVKLSFSDDNNRFENFDGKILCLDLYEHAYFLDYGYNKDKYLKNAINHLDIGRVLDNSQGKAYN